jgi:hypothetical protein
MPAAAFAFANRVRALTGKPLLDHLIKCTACCATKNGTEVFNENSRAACL